MPLFKKFNKIRDFVHWKYEELLHILVLMGVENKVGVNYAIEQVRK